jgi:2-keto-4-pentenoate hydratase
MITANAAQSASDTLWHHWQAGSVMVGLPGEMRPQSRADGYAIQARLEAHTAGAIVGWKIAATSRMGQIHIGVDGPMAGRLLAERVHASGATLSLRGNRMRVAEPEFAFRAGRDITPRSKPYDVTEVLAAMDAFIPGIEVPDSRFENFVTAGGPQLIADNACAHEFVLGTPMSGDWRAIDLSRHAVKGTLAGKLVRDGIGSNVLGDPREALTWLVNELSGLGITLARGQVVTTGACMQPLDVVPGDAFEADFGVLGRVSVRFASD